MSRLPPGPVERRREREERSTKLFLKVNDNVFALVPRCVVPPEPFEVPDAVADRDSA